MATKMKTANLELVGPIFKGGQKVAVLNKPYDISIWLGLYKYLLVKF